MGRLTDDDIYKINMEINKAGLRKKTLPKKVFPSKLGYAGKVRVRPQPGVTDPKGKLVIGEKEGRTDQLFRNRERLRNWKEGNPEHIPDKIVSRPGDAAPSRQDKYLERYFRIWQGTRRQGIEEWHRLKMPTARRMFMWFLGNEYFATEHDDEGREVRRSIIFTGRAAFTRAFECGYLFPDE